MPTISRVYCMARAALMRRAPFFGPMLFELALFCVSPCGVAEAVLALSCAGFLGEEGCAQALQQSARAMLKDNVPWSLMSASERVSFAAPDAPARRSLCSRRRARSWAPRR